MNRSPPQIERPGLLAGLAGLAASIGAVACLSVLTLAQAAETAPVAVSEGTARLEATLTNAPVIASGGEGPVVFALVAPDCGECPDFAAEELAALRREGFHVRVIGLRAGNGPNRQAVAETMAENGEAMQLPAVFWRRGGEWRAKMGRDPDLIKDVRADFGPEA